MNPNVLVREAISAEQLVWDSIVTCLYNYRLFHKQSWIKPIEAYSGAKPLNIVIEKESNVVACLPGFLIKIAFLRFIAAISMVVCNSQESAAAVRSHVGNRKHVAYFPNIVQPIRNVELCRTTWRQRLEISANEVLILGTSRLTPQKNFTRFIKTVALIHQRLPIRAVVAGKDDGHLEKPATAGKCVWTGTRGVQIHRSRS